MATRTLAFGYHLLGWTGPSLDLPAAPWGPNLRGVYQESANGNGFVSYQPGMPLNAFSGLEPGQQYLFFVGTAFELDADFLGQLISASTLAAMQGQLAGLTDQLVEATAQVTALQAQVSAQMAQIADLQAQIASMSTPPVTPGAPGTPTTNDDTGTATLPIATGFTSPAAYEIQYTA